MITKTCSACRTEKSLDCFHREAANKIDGRQRVCKNCTHVHNKEWDEKNPGCRKALRKQWYVENGERVRAERKANREAIQAKQRERIVALRQLDPKLMWAKSALSSARSRARILGLPFSLTAQDIVARAPDYCPALGIKLLYPAGYPGTHKLNHASPTVDRLIPSLGYVAGNIAVISMKANWIKNDANVAEITAVAAWLSGVLKPRKIA